MENNSDNPIPQYPTVPDVSNEKPSQSTSETHHETPAFVTKTSPTNPTWLLLTIFSLILVGTGFSVYSYFKTSPMQPAPDAKMQRVAASSMEKPDAVWNTYRSNVNPFVFVYPNTLYPHTNSYNNVDEIVFKPVGKVASTMVDAKGGIIMKLYAPGEMIPDIVNMNDFADGVKAKFVFDYKDETVTVNNLQIRKLSGYAKAANGEKGKYISDIFIKTNDGAMYAQFITGESPLLTQEVIEQIIQSLTAEKATATETEKPASNAAQQ